MNNKSYKKTEVVELVKKELITALDSSMRVQSLPDIIQASRLIDGFLREHLKDVLSKLSSNVISGSRYNEKSTELEIGGSSYEVRLGENIRNSGIIEVALMPRPIELTKSKAKRERFRLTGHGRYKRADIWLPDEVELDRAWFSEATEVVFQTGYRWLEERIRIVTSQPEVSVGIEIYTYLRSIINNERLLENIWFGCSIKGRGVFLIDPTIATTGLNIISRYAAKTGESALHLIAEYLGCEIPAEKTFGTIAVNQNKCMDFDLLDAKYREDLPLFLRVQMVVMKSRSITILPIFRAGRASFDYLQCVFPTEKKEVLLPILSQHKEKLTDLFARSRRHRLRLLKLFRHNERSVDASSSGAFAGALIGATLKELSKPY